MRYRLFTLFLISILFCVGAESFTGRGKITTIDSTTVQYALVKFVLSSDTSIVFSAVTDTVGEYTIILTSVSEPEPTAQSFTLYQNYPNPFSEQTTIACQVKQPTPVVVNIYNILGQRIRILKQENTLQNIGEVHWDGRDEMDKKVASGIYFYSMKVGDVQQVKKMLLLENLMIGHKVVPYLSQNNLFASETIYQDTVGIYTVYVKNTDSTKPKIESRKIDNVIIYGDTVINFQVEEAYKWEILGLESETVTAIAVHPTDTSVIYVGTAYDFSAGHMGKLFKSIDSGKTWDTLIVGQPLFSFLDIVIDPIHPETLYTIPLPILKSTNGGKIWFDISNGIRIDWETRVSSIAIDPKNTNILYAGTGGFFGGSFYKSINGGESWSDISRDSLLDGVISIAIDPNNSKILYAGTAWRGILWKTIDAGETWFRTGLGETGSIIDAVTVSPFNSNQVYARVRFEGLFKSYDGGINFEKTIIPDSIGVFTILFSKLQPGTIYLATAYGCIMMSEGNNPCWFYINEGLDSFISKTLNIIVFYKNEDFILAGRTKGIGNGGIYVRRIRN